jgi:UDP-N-acetylglucosamine 2-epimerase
MRNVLRALRTIGEDGDKLVVLPLHLNPAVRNEALGLLGNAPNVRLLPPLQYPDFVHLLSRAWCVVSDSGGVQEEAPAFGLQILITRDTTERPEVIESGFGRLVASDMTAIVEGVRELTSASEPMLLASPNPFGAGDAGERIAAALIDELRPAADINSPPHALPWAIESPKDGADVEIPHFEALRDVPEGGSNRAGEPNI